jgi:predicted Zn finger-like uncharacterized protein
LLTQCPHCSATFRVNDEQLAAAHGKVRCGACMKVFNARDSLLSVPVGERQDKKPLSMPVSASKPTVADQVEQPRKKVEHGNLRQQGSSLEGNNNLFAKAFEKNKPTSNGRDLLFQDNPEEDQIESGYSGSLVSDSLLTDSFRELGGNENERKLFNHATDESDSLAADESWAESMLNDLDKPNPSPFPPDNHQSTFTMAGEENPEGSVLQNRRQNLSNPLQDDFALRADPKPGFGHYTAAPIRVPSTPIQGSHRPLASKLLLAFLIIVLLVVLIAQLGLYHFDRLAREEWIRPLYTYVCDVLKPLGCELPRLTDVNKVRSEDLVVRSHPLVAEALIIDAVLVNDASFEQPFPAISLSFSDINNNVVAQRVFLPAEYLSGETRLNKLMPSKTPVPVSLELKDPGKLAVNYTIRLREAPSEGADTGS